jgi:hypothetical protein
MPMSIEEALGTLIRIANPYTSGAERTMHFAAAKPAEAGNPPMIDPHQIPVEQDNYTAQWTFKGQTQIIAKALRIEYTYPMKNKAGDTYHVTEHLLIGFAGSGGSC